MLIKNGADIDAKLFTGYSALDIADIYGNTSHLAKKNQSS